MKQTLQIIIGPQKHQYDKFLIQHLRNTLGGGGGGRREYDYVLPTLQLREGFFTTCLIGLNDIILAQQKKATYIFPLIDFFILYIRILVGEQNKLETVVQALCSSEVIIINQRESSSKCMELIIELFLYFFCLIQTPLHSRQ